MKKLFFSLFCLGTLPLLAQKSADIKSIKSMCGCYEVKFNFAETFAYAKDSSAYKPSKVKHDRGLEWVELVSESPNELVLQHLLIVDDTTIIKHWRQDWGYEQTNLYTYEADNVWKFEKLAKTRVKGQWTQKVFQVDDSPRYEGSATWVHVDGRHFWENTTDAPLPRREHTIRKDYNVLKRGNLHEIVATGWIHEQDNQKIVRESGKSDILLAEEKGMDVYTKVEDSKCLAAQKWWATNKSLWAKVRSKWAQVYGQNQNLQLLKSVDEKPLFMHLFALPTNASQTEIDAIIDRFVVKKSDSK